MNHDLKIHPHWYQAVKEGRKTFEIRKNDRGFQAGDTVKLRYWDPDTCQYNFTVPDLRFRIGYVLPIDAERVVFSLLPTAPSDERKG